MVMPERSFSSEKYRWGFNGKETDNEVKGAANSLDFGARIYDSRLGRWLSCDPLQNKYPYLSTYHAFGNSPILITDIDGKENMIYIVILPSAKTTLKPEDIISIIAKTQETFRKTLHIDVQVVEFKEQDYGGEFNGKNLDKSDVAVGIGSVQEVKDFAKKNMTNPDNYKQIFGDFKGNLGKNPERSERRLGKPEFGRIVGIDVQGIQNSAADAKVSTNDFISDLIVHGSGHTADLGHQEDVNVSGNPNVMTDAKIAVNMIRGYIKPANESVATPKNYNDFFVPSSANNYTSNGFKGEGNKFSEGKHKDNYKLNKGKN